MDERIDYKKINIPSAKEYLGNKNIVFTGRGFLVRGELSRLARQAGGNVDSLVSKRTDLLIVGDKPGSKLRKAKIIGCDIITTEDFKQIMYGNYIKSNESDKENYNIYNININESKNESIDELITGKKIILLVDNNVLFSRIHKTIDKYKGLVLDKAEVEKSNLIVYEPKSKNDKYIKIAKKYNIKVMTVGSFNRLSI